MTTTDDGTLEARKARLQTRWPRWQVWFVLPYAGHVSWSVRRQGSSQPARFTTNYLDILETWLADQPPALWDLAAELELIEQVLPATPVTEQPVLADRADKLAREIRLRVEKATGQVPA